MNVVNPACRPCLRRRRAAGFTLMELLAAIAIISILMALLIPMVVKSRKVAADTRTRHDLETIRTALDEYKNVYGMYPAIAPLPQSPNTPANSPANNINNIDGFPILSDNGAHALYSALMLRGQVRVSRSVDSTGNKVVVGGTTAYGPFLNSEQIKSEPDPTLPTSLRSGNSALLCDANGNPILYIPAATIQLNYTKTATKTPSNPYLASSTATATGTPVMPYYDFAAVPQFIPDPNYSGPMAPPAVVPTVVPFRNPNYTGSGLNEMRVLMGDDDQNGIIDTTLTTPEQAATNGPYLLWTAGRDGRFGIDPTTGKTDDIANFDLAPKYRQ